MKKRLLILVLLLAILMIPVAVAELKRQVPLNNLEPVVHEPAVKIPEVSDIDIFLLFEATNKHRQAGGRKMLSLNPLLSQSALNKCNDMVRRDYWSHKDPKGNEPWEFIKPLTDYQAAGENLAYGHADAESVVTGWINSPGHNENLLNKDFTDVGFGVCLSENYVNEGRQVIVVQHFIQR